MVFFAKGLSFCFSLGLMSSSREITVIAPFALGTEPVHLRQCSSHLPLWCDFRVKPWFFFFRAWNYHALLITTVCTEGPLFLPLYYYTAWSENISTQVWTLKSNGLIMQLNGRFKFTSDSKADALSFQCVAAQIHKHLQTFNGNSKYNILVSTYVTFYCQASHN